MTNPPDPKTKTPRSDKCLSQYDDFGQYRSEPRRLELLAIESSTLELENQSLTRRLEEVTKERDAYRSEVVSVINHLPSNCIVHVTDLPAQESDCATLAVSVAKLAAKLTALRTAAEGLAKHGSTFIRLSFFQGINQAEYQHDRENHELAKRISETSCNLQDAEDAFNAALAALRAELDQADSNASNSPTASRESQG